VECLVRAYEETDKAGAKDQRFHHITVLMLVRHVIECLDAVAVLVSKGCIPPCDPLLRSGMEALLGILYILEKDSEQRGLAYQVAHAHKKIKFYQRCDPNHPSGQQLRKDLQYDPIGGDVLKELPPQDYSKYITNLQAMLQRPEYQPIEQAWQAAKKGSKKGGTKNSDPAWFSLFGGPANVRELAIYLKQPAMYEFMYRQWSDKVHAGSVLENVARSSEGQQVRRPIRHPDGLPAVLTFAGGFCLELARRLLLAYAPEQMSALRTHYIEDLRGRQQTLRSTVIRAPWK
jgi:hypothetical protein